MCNLSADQLIKMTDVHAAVNVYWLCLVSFWLLMMQLQPAPLRYKLILFLNKLLTHGSQPCDCDSS